MKLSNLVWSLFGMVALSACSNNEVMEPGGDPAQDGAKDRYMSVVISNPIGTRASDYEEGGVKENAINTLRFYFFDGSGNPVAVSKLTTNIGTTNFVDAIEITEAGKEMENVEKKYNAIVVLNTTDLQNQAISKMVAVANFEDANLGAESLSLADLQAKVGAYTMTVKDGKGHFMMTSSSYADANGQINEAAITAANLRLSKEAAQANPVQVYIERVLAKTRLGVNITKEGVTTETFTENGVEYTAIPLKDQDGNDIKISRKDVAGETEQQVYVVFTGWNVTGQPNMSYLFKKVFSTTDWTTDKVDFIWNNPSYFRSYWAMNPTNDGSTNAYALGYDNYTSINKVVGNDSVYCMENAGDSIDGTKRTYNPATARTNRTQAIIAARLYVKDGDTFKKFDLAKWGGLNYTREGALNAMLGTVHTQIYKKVNDETKSIEAADVVFVPAASVGQANTDVENSPRYRNCLQLKTGSTTTFYSDAECTKEMTPEDVNALLKLIPGANIWKDGRAYYYTDLRHLGANVKTGLYGVVRNHIYDVKITNVVGLGTPVDDETQIIYPQKPENDETYIAAQINVLSWRVVSNDTELTW